MSQSSSTPPRLTVEAVPRTCWFSNVRSEVTAASWDRIRAAVYAAAGHRCQVCGGVGHRHPVEAHEVWSYVVQGGKYRQVLTGMVALCPRCHEVKHLGLAQVRGREEAALGHLAMVNGWSPQEVAQHVREAGEVWRSRSKVAWELDLQGLAPYGSAVVFRPPAA